MYFGEVGCGEVDSSLEGEPFFPPFRLLLSKRADFFLGGWEQVKYFSPMMNFCVCTRCASTPTSTTWAVFVLLDRVGGGEGGVVGHRSSYMSFISLVRLDLLLPSFLFPFLRDCRSDARHAQTCADRSDQVESAGHRGHEGGHGRVRYVPPVHLLIYPWVVY